MDIQTCLKKLELVGVLSFATVGENGEPQVRSISALMYEGTNLRFLTSRGKDFCRELLQDGRVQILAYTRYKEMIRVSGKVIPVPEEKQSAWRDALFEEQPVLNNVYPGETRNITIIFELKDYTIEYFCLSTYPITREYFVVGNAIPKLKGYHIAQNCIECGICAGICPQKAIDAGSPYKIRENNCLHCGNCYENCPVQAVERY